MKENILYQIGVILNNNLYSDGIAWDGAREEIANYIINDLGLNKKTEAITMLLDSIEFVSTEHNANYVIKTNDIKILKEALE